LLELDLTSKSKKIEKGVLSKQVDFIF